MAPLSGLPDALVLTAYVLVFGGAAVACFAGVPRARTIVDDDTRRGLVALLLITGGWATAHVGFLVMPTPSLQLAFYYLGLLLGIAAVGPWLYFCSAYTGRSLHRASGIRRAAIALFLGIALVKLTNPLHHVYFQTEVATTPFPHLVIHNQPLHWLAMGLAYALATIGYFMLFELAWQAGQKLTSLLALVSITALPVVLDVLGAVSPLLLDITYEPLGVAGFAIGIVFLYLDEFQAIQVAGEHDAPVIVLDDADRVRDYNTEAQDLFPGLELGTTIDAVIPELTGSRDTDDAVLEIERVGGLQYYQVTTRPFTADESQLGEVITLTDITEREQYRMELERQNERLDQFASMVSHDLRNPLNVATGRLDLAQQEHPSEHLEAIERALDRMGTLIDDVLALARQGQPISETEPVALSALVEECWSVVDTHDATYTIERDLRFTADRDRLQQLLENLVRNAIEHGGEAVTIRVGALDEDVGFYVADDGPGIPEEDRAEVLESGYTTAEDGTGFGLAIVAEIVEAHGWSIAVTESDAGGARFEITGVERVE